MLPSSTHGPPIYFHHFPFFRKHVDLPQLMSIESTPPNGTGNHFVSLRTKLLQAYRDAPNPKPRYKEYLESYYFFLKCEDLIARCHEADQQLCVDVCGGHGLVGLLFAVHGRAKDVLLLDLMDVQSFWTMREAWAPLMPPGVKVTFKKGDVRNTFPDALQALEPSQRAFAVAVHACGALTDYVIGQCVAHRVSFAVLPCCHQGYAPRHAPKVKGRYPGTKDTQQWQTQVKHAASVLEFDFGAAMDLVRMGKVLVAGFNCKWRCIPKHITPKNHMLVGLCPIPSPPEAACVGSGCSHVSTYRRMVGIFALGVATGFAFCWLSSRRRR